MAFSFSFPIVVLCLFVSFNASLGYSQDLVSRPIDKHHQLNGNYGGGYYKVATVYPFAGFQFWEGECFKKNDAYLTYPLDLSRGYIVVDVSEARNPFCSDSYQFKTGDQLLAEDSFFSALLPKHVPFESQDRELRKYIKDHGVDIYLKKSGNQQKQEEKVTESLTSTDGGGASAI
ncbi:hypothetical protein Tsubulata_040409 [Turnera subulata]|uniref:Phytocyanin domain-containing protein n=1 Tax=Turnera subulata TaxID=218843 RepID=A0A9Q0J7P1_9ROSI|nr:hypothetical protein Tsubulata_040409 [Turnera subulata]